jgi:hypothetical protein
VTKQLAAAFGPVVAFAMVVTAAHAEVFASPDGAFTVEFPAAPKLAKSQGQTDKGTGYAETRWSVRNKDGYWAVAMFAYAKPRKADTDANVRGAVAAAKGRLASDQRILQNGVEGREILIEAGKSVVVRERILWVAGTLYLVAYAGDSAAAAFASAVDEFLISFEAAR